MEVALTGGPRLRPPWETNVKGVLSKGPGVLLKDAGVLLKAPRGPLKGSRGPGGGGMACRAQLDRKTATDQKYHTTVCLIHDFF